MSVEHVLKVTHLFYNKIKAECVFWLICILVAANVVQSAVLLQFALNKTISFYFQRFSVQWVWLFFTQKLWTTSDGLKTTRNKTRAGPSSSWFPPSCVSSFPVWQLSWPPGGSGETTVTDQWRSPTVREQTDNMVLCHFTVTDWWDHMIFTVQLRHLARGAAADRAIAVKYRCLFSLVDQNLQTMFGSLKVQQIQTSMLYM